MYVLVLLSLIMGKAKLNRGENRRKELFQLHIMFLARLRQVANNQVDDATPGPSHTSNIDIVLPPSNTATKHKSIYKHVKNKSQEKLVS